MSSLINEFQDSIQAMGLSQDSLKRAVFHCAPVGLRFEIGGQESVYKDDSVNPEYFYQALCRAVSIYAALPIEPDILRIDIGGEDQKRKLDYSGICTLIGLPPAAEYAEETDPDGNIFTAFYWNLRQLKQDLVNCLIREIIMADIGGNALLASSVYFLNTSNKMLYHLYDDRGADLIAASKDMLLPFYKRFQAWLLSYNRKKMAALFLDDESDWHQVESQERLMIDDGTTIRLLPK